MSETTCENTMTSAVYEERRNKLLELLEKVSPYEHFDLKTRETFERAIQKLQSDSFEIVLVGEFQGGKSTTFNALCDGRDISPMGVGVKTSACRITARNIVDPNEEERAEIRWKSDDEILLNMLDILRRHISEKDFEFYSRRDARGVFTNLSLQSEKDRALLADVLQKEWAIYSACPARYDADGAGKLDLLYVASLNLRFYNDPILEKYRREKQIVKVEELKDFVRFPIDWATRWTQKTPDAFKPEEIAATFIGDVQCYIHSQNLQRLGCVVTDCPGLFAGPWDTQVAREAMLNADSIIYLLRGDKAIGEQDLNALREIRKIGQFRKLFFTMNARASYEHLKNMIRPANTATINNSLGEKGEDAFSVKSEDIYIFHALLGYKAKSRAWLQEGSFEERSWKREIEKHLTVFIDPMNEEEDREIETAVKNYDRILELTKFNHLLDAVENAAIRQKAFSLLMANGALAVGGALDQLESKLKLQEENATKSVERAQEEVKNAEDALHDFQNRSREIVQTELDDDSCKGAIAEDFVKRVYIESVPRLADNLFGKIDYIFNDEKESLKLLCGIFVDFLKKKFKKCPESHIGKFGEAIQGYVSESIEEECEPAAQGWFTDLTQSSRSVYQTAVKPKLKYIDAEITRVWKEVVVDSNAAGVEAYLEGLTPPCATLAPTVVGVMRSFDSGGMLGAMRGAMVKRLTTGIVANVVGIITGVVSMVVAAVLVAYLLPTNILAIPATVASIIVGLATGGAVCEQINEFFKSRIDAGLKRELEPKLLEAFKRQDVYQNLENSGLEVADGVMEEIGKFYNDAFDEQLHKFEELRDEALFVKQKAADEQLRIAEEARQIRNDVVKFATEVDEFIGETEPYFK